MEQIFTTQFWQEAIAEAPWVIPPLLIGGIVGWRWKGANDDGEIRELRARVETAAERLELADEKLELADERYEAIVNQVNELKEKIAQQDKVIAELENELKKTAIAPVRLNELAASNTEIKKSLTDLSTSTSNLGRTLEIIRGITHRSE
jgi:chromosome segregation ATPase